MSSKQTAAEKKSLETKKAMERDLPLATKAEEIHTLVENQIADGVEQVLHLEEKAHRN